MSFQKKQTNPNRKNKHATKVMLSMKLKIVVRKVQKNVKRLQLQMDCHVSF